MTYIDMIPAITDIIKQNVESEKEQQDSPLTSELAQAEEKVIKQVISVIGTAWYKAYLESRDRHEPSIIVDGEEYRLKGPVEKKFLTFFGPMVLSRNLYQNKSDTKSYIPLDAAWGMIDEFMTVGVRDAVLYNSALGTTKEVQTQFQKCALFQPSVTAMKRVIAATGKLIAEHKEELDAAIRKEEPITEGTCVLVASADGTNVLLKEKGVKRGRPAERPAGEETKEASAVYKNAMVGSISFYGEVPEGEHTPERLACHYTSHMPEKRAPTFKKHFEAEVKDAQSKCGPNVKKVLLLDGARPLWNYVESTPLFDDYEKLIDYWHTLEHLSAAAEALYGKGSTVGKLWYNIYQQVLLVSDTGAQSILQSIDEQAVLQKLSVARQKELNTQRTFFEHNQHRMQYAQFRRRGLPIGSGPVEAAGKSLVKTRMCRSGMRWTRPGGEHILDIRTYVKSGRWDAAWGVIQKFSKAA